MITSIFVEGRGYYFAEKQNNSNGANYFSLITLSGDWFQCFDYNEKIIKAINKNYVVEVNY